MKLTALERRLRGKHTYSLSFVNSSTSNVSFSTPGYDVWIYKVYIIHSRNGTVAPRIIQFNNKQISNVPMDGGILLYNGNAFIVQRVVWLPCGWYIPANTRIEIPPQTAILLFGVRATPTSPEPTQSAPNVPVSPSDVPTPQGHIL